MNPTRRHCLTALVLLSTTAATAPSTLAAEPTLANLRENEVASALRQALEIAAGHTVRRLGQADGFLGNEKVRIPAAERPRQGGRRAARGGPRHAGAGTREHDESRRGAGRTRSPRAADEHHPHADHRGRQEHPHGPEDAATQFFKAKTSDELVTRFVPIVANATKRLRLAEAYNKIANRAVPFGLVRSEDANLDQYVARKAMDGLFVTLAEEEKVIRANPLESGKKLVRKVFGVLLP